MRALSKDLIYFSKEKGNDKDLAINFLTYFERKPDREDFKRRRAELRLIERNYGRKS